MIQNLKKAGYNVGHIATEPSGYLFGADFVYHFGYQSKLDIMPWESIAILNKMTFDIQDKDILISGCQSATLHYNNSQIEDFAIYQYAFMLGIMADFYILTVNLHDEIEYIKRTIDFINSVDSGKVEAIVVFPVLTYEILKGMNTTTKQISEKKIEVINRLKKCVSIPIYLLGEKNNMENLVDYIISYFQER